MAAAMIGCCPHTLPDRQDPAAGPGAARPLAPAQDLFDLVPSSQLGNFHGQQLCASAGNDENAVATFHQLQHQRTIM